MNEGYQNELLELQRKQLFHARLKNILLSVVLATLLGAGLVFVLTVGRINTLTKAVNEKLDQISAEKITNAADALNVAADKLKDVDIKSFNQAAGSFTVAVDKLRDLDINELNKAVEAFTEATDRLEALDLDGINALVNSLTTVSVVLENLINGLTSIFN